MRPKLLLLGASGQVGQSVSNLAGQYGLDCQSVTRNQWDMAQNPTGAVSALGHLLPDIIINAAAYTAVDRAEEEPNLASAVNAESLVSLSEFALKLRIPILHLSTDYVFDGQKKTPYSEEDEVNPVSVYGQTKLLGENYVRQTCEKHVIVRTSWVFSPDGSNFLKSILKAAEMHDQLRVVNDQFGGPTSAKCIAKVLLKIASNYLNGASPVWGTFHFGGYPFVSWFEFANEILSRSESGVETKLIPCSSRDYKAKAQRPSNSTLDMKKIKASYDIDPCNWKEELNFII